VDTEENGLDRVLEVECIGGSPCYTDGGLLTALQHIHRTALTQVNTTPRRVTQSIRDFLATLDINRSPILIPYTRTCADYRAGYCLSNCEAETRCTGSPTVFGWIIWEDRANAFIEAEFHAVIRRRAGFVDITPRKDGETVILFAADSARSALRVDARTWTTWRNHKSINGIVFEPTHLLDIEETK
jgi:hypothetical protein